MTFRTTDDTTTVRRSCGLCFESSITQGMIIPELATWRPRARRAVTPLLNKSWRPLERSFWLFGLVLPRHHHVPVVNSPLALHIPRIPLRLSALRLYVLPLHLIPRALLSFQPGIFALAPAKGLSALSANTWEKRGCDAYHVAQCQISWLCSSSTVPTSFK